jgi:hypothetical protein
MLDHLGLINIDRELAVARVTATFPPLLMK